MLPLCLLILGAEFFSHLSGVPLVQDLGGVLLVISLIRLLLNQWGSLQKEGQDDAVVLRIVGILGTLLLWSLWFSRWRNGWDAGFTSPILSQDRAYVQLAAILSFVNFASVHPFLQAGWSILELTPGRKILGLYLVACIAGTAFLIMPWTHRPENPLSLIDALFITVSALSVTGLAPIDVGQEFTPLGLLTLLGLIQLGGLGIVVISALVASVTRKRLSLTDSQMGLELYDIPAMGGVSAFLKKVVITTIVLEAMGALAIYFTIPAEVEDRMFHSVFHSISAFCNAGFSSLPSNLENPLTRWARWPIAVLIVLGGIGFPVIFEVLQRWKKKHLSLLNASPHLILTLSISFGLLFVGATALFLTESARPEQLMGAMQRLEEGFFYSISARTAGFNLTPLVQFGVGSQLIIVLLMVVGGSPLSTAGGIKTTTAGLILVSVWSFLRGRTWVQFHRREVSPLTLQKSITVVVLYAVVVSIALLILIVTESQEAWPLTFEVISALSTTGLSLGVTSELTPFGKLLISGIMLTGRIGLVTMILVGLGKAEEQRYRYPVGHFFAG